MNSEFQTREAFVIFVPNRGYLKNKNNDFVSEFAKARLFGRESDAANSVKMNNITLSNALVIPVQMTLDPKQVFKAVLKGA